MAQTKRKRRRKHRGTQGGKIDTRPRGKPRNRAEARQRAQQRRSTPSKGGRSRQRGIASDLPAPPTWGGAIRKGLIAAAIFFVLLALAFQRPVGSSAAIAVFMTAFYVPMAYFTDKFFYNRQLAKQQRERAAAKQG